ncbi:MAG: T9SS type A sorting domain-containing protein [Fibromonadaceae bacterium]|jgi:endo-1,4-beta-D-glucanase Y|nr:T9SS type A sorting domain-containing protein [Fibromonadaceae bacterium]
MLKKITAILALAVLLAYSQTTVNYPYPMRKNYGNNTINAINSTADADLKTQFQAYMDNFYEEGNCSGTKDCARIKFYDPDEKQANNGKDWTVSEGIGYAMLMAVYFSDKTKSYKSEFDKLWKYYQKWSQSTGSMMHWKINGFSSVNQTGSASDADFDVALALAMANYQFGGTSYLNDAKALIAKIRQHDFDNNGLHLPGDSWGGSADNNRNPSYVAPAAFQIFKEVEGNQDAAWDKIITKNYSFLTTNKNSSSGLPSDWANTSGTPQQCSACGYTGTKYGQDAVRAPWRWATAKAWFGGNSAHSSANTLLGSSSNNTLAYWVNGKNATDIKGPIDLNGTIPSSGNSNASYIGSLMCALMNVSAYQTKLNSFFSTMVGQTDRANSSYYNQSMLLLTGLLASGNMPNLKACASTSGCGTNMPAIGGGDGNSTILDRLAVAGQDTEDNRNLSAIWEGWYAYTDKDADGGNKAKSTIDNATYTSKDENNNCANTTSYRVVLKGTGTDTEWAVRIVNYKIDGGTYAYEPFVGLGLDARKNGKPASQGGYDLSKCTNGFSYQYKGPPHKFKALSSELTEGKGFDHFKNIKATSANNGTGWSTATIPPNELEQPTGEWVTEKKPFNLAKVRAWGWEILGKAKDGTGGIDGTPATGNLAIKDFKCLGKMDLPAQPTPKCGGTPVPTSSSSVGNSGGSSSSRANSSSSGGGSSSSVLGGGSSSSALGSGSSSSIEGDSSSSEGEDTPIISISKHAANNGVFAIKNGVNLQVSKTASVEVFSLNGKSMRRHEFSSGSYSIILNDLPKGLYIVKIQFESQKEILRVPVR